MFRYQTIKVCPPRTTGTRRFLYRATLGRLRSPDNIIKSSEGKVDGLRVKMSDYSNEAKKLEVSAVRWYLVWLCLCQPLCCLAPVVHAPLVPWKFGAPCRRQCRQSMTTGSRLRMWPWTLPCRCLAPLEHVAPRTDGPRCHTLGTWPSTLSYRCLAPWCALCPGH